MMTAVADTHAVIWYLNADSRLSETARMFIESAATDGNTIGVSSITPAEMIYLVEKGRISSGVFQKLLEVLSDPDGVFEEIPLDLKIVEAMSSVPRTDVPDFPDRIIAASGVWLKVPVISRDGKITASSIQTIW
jgi:PIN domain nuclease of toxin-antitoxin system